MKIALLLLVLSLQVFAAEELWEEDLNTPPQVSPDDVRIDEQNELTGVLDKNYYTSEDETLISIKGQTTKALVDMTEYLGAELHFAKRLDTSWLGGFASIARTKFQEISENNDGQTKAGGARPEDLDYNLISFGFGAHYRFRFPIPMISNDRLFHTTNIYGAYHIMSELNSDVDAATNPNYPYADDFTYKGYGLRVDYGIHYRSSRSFYYGLNLTYNLALMERGEEYADEPSSARRMQISWFSLGVDLGFYF